ncbi:hypothetical protein IV203_025598 [Nitzschia inconspicua]|uniref:Uncharacterized protein n=1 Tax=Nitzschia inconspicua TaxID=303405 RepID=A0A9K3PW40_9STRA|nr:hypothetical protein IV203_025598 [Nitzschia inconspicua]
MSNSLSLLLMPSGVCLRIPKSCSSIKMKKGSMSLGFAGRADAKKAEKVGLDKVQAFLHYNSRINKVMCVAFTGYAFEGNMENGSHWLEAWLLPMQCCQDCKEAGSKESPALTWQSEMPHANNLDLAIFPSMSHRHSSLISEYSNTEAPADQIWKAALSLSNTLANSTIARGSVLAKRIHREDINSKGDNTFLPTKNFHAGVRSDVEDTFNGLQKNEEYSLVA